MNQTAGPKKQLVPSCWTPKREGWTMIADARLAAFERVAEAARHASATLDSLNHKASDKTTSRDRLAYLAQCGARADTRLRSALAVLEDA